jgi:hypothetical protein
VISAAPDDASLAAARKLARPGPWSETGSNGDLVWGKCQGSGKTPYQVSVDTVAPAYRCSCPSRKFPCKHALRPEKDRKPPATPGNGPPNGRSGPQPAPRGRTGSPQIQPRRPNGWRNEQH